MRLISLTRKATERIPAARAELEEVADPAMARFSAEEQATLVALLRRVAKNLESA